MASETTFDHWKVVFLMSKSEKKWEKGAWYNETPPMPFYRSTRSQNSCQIKFLSRNGWEIRMTRLTQLCLLSVFRGSYQLSWYALAPGSHHSSLKTNRTQWFQMQWLDMGRMKALVPCSRVKKKLFLLCHFEVFIKKKSHQSPDQAQQSLESQHPESQPVKMVK